MERGLVIRGSRNIFTVRLFGEGGGDSLECRIKGKILKGVECYYNPLAPGDYVAVEKDPSRPGTGLVLAVEERRNRFTRFNQKGLGANRSAASQLLAANIDLVLCVASPASPPFRPRFLDRALVQTEIAGIPAVIVCNKHDLFDGDIDTDERLEDFARIGYPVLRVSAKTGEGMEELRLLVEGKLSVLVGQSGAGKSSLINALLPGTRARVGGINEKYDRGNHTTAMSVLFEGPGIRLIDTPGIRRLLPDGVSAGELIHYMKEFAPLAGKCSYGLSCSHQTEPGCKVLEAVAAGAIHEDRYESYLRIREELAGLS
ncbi:MAG: ribosome small subunit-dependent GTPase A [Spirochaetaceae bacterium]|jgi:ribosome biogenesis GTPase|nr:ribosome small subunit-dependent GTPase A [Spirochaetaceae bacterium]